MPDGVEFIPKIVKPLKEQPKEQEVWDKGSTYEKDHDVLKDCISGGHQGNNHIRHHQRNERIYSQPAPFELCF